MVTLYQVNDNDELAQRRKDKEVERHKDMIAKLQDEHKAQVNTDGQSCLKTRFPYIVHKKYLYIYARANCASSS